MQFNVLNEFSFLQGRGGHVVTTVTKSLPVSDRESRFIKAWTPHMPKETVEKKYYMAILCVTVLKALLALNFKVVILNKIK